MNAKIQSLIPAALASASIMLLSAAAAQAAPTRSEINEVLEVQILHEAGYTFPSIEEMLKTRKATARAEPEKATNAQDPVARARPEKTVVKN